MYAIYKKGTDRFVATFNNSLTFRPDATENDRQRITAYFNKELSTVANTAKTRGMNATTIVTLKPGDEDYMIASLLDMFVHTQYYALYTDEKEIE